MDATTRLRQHRTTPRRPNQKPAEPAKDMIQHPADDPDSRPWPRASPSRPGPGRPRVVLAPPTPNHEGAGPVAGSGWGPLGSTDNDTRRCSYTTPATHTSTAHPAWVVHEQPCEPRLR